MIKSAVILLTGMSMFLALGCSGSEQSYRFPDVTVGEKAVFKKLAGQGNIHGFELKGDGYIDGKAEITLFLNGTPYRTEKLHGDVSFNWNGDWYADSAEVVYKPATVKYGHLTVLYGFKDFKDYTTPKNFPAEKKEDKILSKDKPGTDWHKGKWQNSPAIITINKEEIRLLFNRPEIVFLLRRGIDFKVGDKHEYADKLATTTYLIRSLEESKATIEYESRFADGTTTSGVFTVTPQGE